MTTYVPAASIPSIPPLELSIVTTLGNDYRASRAIWVASLALLLYDHALTFDRELAYLQRHGFGWHRALFLANRYWPILSLLIDNIALAVSQPPEEFCIYVFNWIWYGGIPLHICIGTILIMRLYAMYNRSKHLLVTLSVLLVCQLVAETVVLGPILKRMKSVQLPPPFTGCLPDNPSNHMWAYWVPMTFFETLLFSLALIKSFKLARDQAHASRALIVLLRDSVIYLGGVLAILITNLVIWAAARESLLPIAIAPGVAIHSILGCRMLLNIHQAVQPTYGGFASIFASTFVKEDHPIPLRPLHAHPRSATTSDDYDTATRYTLE